MKKNNLQPSEKITKLIAKWRIKFDGNWHNAINFIHDNGNHYLTESGQKIPQNAIQDIDFIDLNKNLDLEDLEKALPAPKKHGETSPDGMYQARKHTDGNLSWYYHPEHAKKTDDFIKQNKEAYLSKLPEEHREIAGKFIDSVANSYTRHAVVAKDRAGGPDAPRARHIKGLLHGNPNYTLTVKSPEELQLFIHERHGAKPRPSLFHFSTKDLKKNADKSKKGRQNVQYNNRIARTDGASNDILLDGKATSSVNGRQGEFKESSDRKEDLNKRMEFSGRGDRKSDGQGRTRADFGTEGSQTTSDRVLRKDDSGRVRVRDAYVSPERYNGTAGSGQVDGVSQNNTMSFKQLLNKAKEIIDRLSYLVFFDKRIGKYVVLKYKPSISDEFEKRYGATWEDLSKELKSEGLVAEEFSSPRNAYRLHYKLEHAAGEKAAEEWAKEHGHHNGKFLHRLLRSAK